MQLIIGRFGTLAAILWAIGLVTPMQGEVKVEKVSYMNLPNCYRLSNGSVELIVTTDVGPRIIRYGFPQEDNILGELPNETLKTEFGDWKPWGGHRLWVAPEAMPRSYSPDNSPIEYHVEGKNTVRLTQRVEPKTGIQKEITVSLDTSGSGVTVSHRITNRNTSDIDVAPWALTIMNGGGVVILPQEPFRAHSEYLLPARPLVLWHYTDLSDPRLAIGKKYIRIKTDDAIAEPQKIGIANKQGWAAYHRKRTLFIKRFRYDEHETYPDYGSNNESYTAGSFIELETLGPMRHLKPGAFADHVERWYLFREVNIGTTEESIGAGLRPHLAQTAP